MPANPRERETLPTMPSIRQLCAVLMATKGRCDLLRNLSLPSVRKQNRPPILVVLVNDGGDFAPDVARSLAALVGIELILLQNRRAPGAAGAWNTGLEFLISRSFDGFVAMLDDDDEWDENHLADNLDAARRADAAVVVSGLRLVRDGLLCDRTIPRDFTERMFLVGNPGWQGSNTFVAMSALAAVGGFRDGMPSANDRDLAIRLLRLPWIRVAYTGKWTATWHLSPDRKTLSSPRSEAKLRGLRWFWQIYGSEMAPAETEEFFTRASELFRISRDEILSNRDDRPPHCELRGDLPC